MSKPLKGLIIAAVKSGSGKTMASLAIMKFFEDNGYKVAPFKTGPDFIDTSHYERICDAKGRNLDTYMMTDDFINWNIAKAMTDKDVAVIEGVMGLFDGYGEEGRGSTAELAKKLNLPVILVVDAKGMSQSIVPLIHGFLNWDNRVPVVGVILNRVNSEKQYIFLKQRIEKIGIKCYGYIQNIPEITVPERHLGIYMGHEQNSNFIEGLNKAVSSLEKERLLKLMENSAKRMPSSTLSFEKKYPLKIAVARDDAFCFVYEETLELFKLNGGYVHYFSPLTDENFGSADLVFLPGGYPELYMEALSKNEEMKEALINFLENGGHLLAECGGLIYLAKEVITSEGPFKGLNLLPFTVEMGKRFASLGYVDVTVADGNPLFSSGIRLKGHRFHYSFIKEGREKVPSSYILERKDSTEKEGFVYKNLLASYVHLHFGSNPDAVKDMFHKIAKKSGIDKRELL